MRTAELLGVEDQAPWVQRLAVLIILTALTVVALRLTIWAPPDPRPSTGTCPPGEQLVQDRWDATLWCIEADR